MDRFCRDSTLFQFTTRRLRDFIDPNPRLMRTDEELDFANLVQPLEECYCPDFGRPTTHPEVMARALLICRIASRENVAETFVSGVRSHRRRFRQSGCSCAHPNTLSIVSLSSDSVRLNEKGISQSRRWAVNWGRRLAPRLWGRLVG